MAILAILDWTLAVTAQLQMDWTTFFLSSTKPNNLRKPFYEDNISVH